MLASDIYQRDVYRSTRDTEHLSTSFQSLGSPKHTCPELRPGAGFCGQFVATLWFSDTWQETREHVESTDSDHLPGSSECRRAYLLISVVSYEPTWQRPSDEISCHATNSHNLTISLDMSVFIFTMASFCWTTTISIYYHHVVCLSAQINCVPIGF